MLSIMKNTFTMFKKNKEFIYLISIQPIFIFLLMSLLLPYTTIHNIVVVNDSETRVAGKISQNLMALEGIKVNRAEADEVEDKLIGQNAEIAVMIADAADSDIPMVNIISIGKSEVESAVELSINETMKSAMNNIDDAGRVEVVDGDSKGDFVDDAARAKVVDGDSKDEKSESEKQDESGAVIVNSTPRKWLGISNTLAFMIFKTLTTGNLLGALIIEERRKKMRDRIMLSGTGKGSYFLGMSLVYLAFMTLGSIFYYLVGLLLRFDFGMRNSLGFLAMLIVSNILSVAIYVFAAAFLKKEDTLGMVGTFILMPMSLFSGVLFPFKFMPDVMQKIGSCFPQRWIALAIEKMQLSGSIMSGWKEALMVLILSAILFTIGVIFEGGRGKAKKT